MGESVAQTPGLWAKGGGSGLTDAECRKALAKCGINPDNFGTYDQRKNAQAAERKEFRDTHLEKNKKKKFLHAEPCEAKTGSGVGCICHESDAAFAAISDPKNGGSVEKWNVANSQSGHAAQNAFHQNKRGDACSNEPPRPGTSGSLGYQDNKALCYDHGGRANDPGTIHYEITQSEAEHAEYLRSKERQKKKPPPVTEQDMEDSVKRTAQIAVDDPKRKGKMDMDDLGEAAADNNETLRDRQKKAANELMADEANSGKAAKTKNKQGQNPSKAKAVKATQADKDLAVKCIVAAWKQSVKEMQDEAVNKHSTVGKSAESKKAVKEYNAKKPPPNPLAKGFTDLPPKTQKQVRDDVESKKSVQNRQERLEGIESPREKGKNKKFPTEEDCREAQANALLGMRKADGTYPPQSGRVPGAGEDLSKEVDG